MKSPYYLICQVGRQWYGIPVAAVIEVLQMVALDELPSSPPDVLGLLNLRNTVMPVIDLRRRFKTDDQSLHLATPIIAIQNKKQALAFAVDAVDDVVDTSSGIWQDQDLDPYITHTVDLQNKLFLILDIESFS